MRGQIQLKVWSASSLPPDWFKRVASGQKGSSDLEIAVKNIIDAVRNNGDSSLVELTEKFDKTKLSVKDLRITLEEIKTAYKKVTKEQIAALEVMKRKIEALEKPVLKRLQSKTSRSGIAVQSTLRAIESVGCYVPGGQAVYPSTLVMTAVPARVAGVPRIVVCSPPTSNGSINPLILVAADICGVDEVYKVGGVQAVAALAYGTETIKPVRKIVGPGSRYVTAAKVLVSQEVAIDMPAGPSEVLVLADETAKPDLVAVDMISQAEHGADSVVGLVTTSEKLAQEVLERLRKMANSVERREIVAAALSSYGFIITCESTAEMVELANVFASEHLEIMTRDALEIADKITSAGVILIGPYTPVALSDYGSGTNHVLPTAGFGHAFSGLSVLDFTRRVNIVNSTKEGLQKVRGIIKVLTQAERLPNHYKAVEARFEN